MEVSIMPFGKEGVEDGIGLALSGGGFRATLFHIGSVWRLNELGFLPKLDRISSISGGSITAGVLGLNWNKLKFENNVAKNLQDLFVNPLQNFCAKNIDGPAIGEGALLPWKSISDAVREEYEDHLFGNSDLQALPDKPRFIINATNFQTGVSFRFSKPYAGDYRLGLIKNPTFSIALAVTASSAFPPVLSPVPVEIKQSFEKVEGADLNGSEEYTKKLYLTDGGVYDNLGLETVWNRYKTVLVSDAGAPLEIPQEVETSWFKQAMRAMNIATNQGRALRKRALIDDYKQKRRKGTYWGIDTKIKNYELSDSLPCNGKIASDLAGLRTRLNPFSVEEQSRLINWGYALCDAALRAHVLEGQTYPAPRWPFQKYKLG
jgi:NTE family protein